MICPCCKSPMLIKESYTHNTWSLCPYCGVAIVDKETKEDLKAAVESLTGNKLIVGAPQVAVYSNQTPMHHRNPSMN